MGLSSDLTLTLSFCCCFLLFWRYSFLKHNPISIFFFFFYKLGWFFPFKAFPQLMAVIPGVMSSGCHAGEGGMELRGNKWKMYEWKPLPMNPSTSMGWGQDLHSVFYFLWKERWQRERESERVSMNEEMQIADWCRGVGGRVRCAVLSQIQLMP